MCKGAWVEGIYVSHNDNTETNTETSEHKVVATVNARFYAGAGRAPEEASLSAKSCFERKAS